MVLPFSFPPKIGFLMVLHFNFPKKNPTKFSPGPEAVIPPLLQVGANKGGE